VFPSLVDSVDAFVYFGLLANLLHQIVHIQDQHHFTFTEALCNELVRTQVYPVPKVINEDPLKRPHEFMLSQKLGLAADTFLFEEVDHLIRATEQQVFQDLRVIGWLTPLKLIRLRSFNPSDQRLLLC
jgi:hypothetical protein